MPDTEPILPALTPDKPLSPLGIEVYTGKTLSSLFEDTLGGLDVAQNETLSMIHMLKNMLEKRRDDSRTEFDVVMMIAPVLKEFIAEYGSQAESKVKVATAVANIVKSQQQASIVNQMMVNQPETGIGNSILQRLKSVDPLEKSFAVQPNTNTPKPQIEETNNVFAAEIEDIHVIHSPDFLASQTKL